MGIEDNKKTVERFLDALSNSRVDELVGMLSDKATWWVAGTFPLSGTMSKQKFSELIGGIGNEIDGHLSVKPKAWTAEGDRVAVEAESYAKLKNGKVYNNFYHFVFEVRNGKIDAVREYLDTEHANQVLCGAQPMKSAAE
jgi:ketosteroid isomerase-like protein